jgi:predicted unusual protein kinase regulating ubiquinone biosynthesis (AarF/ABC1/UbiB family)
LVGSGAFGQVFKAVWKGTIVAAKVILAAGNNKVIDNELKVYQ